MFFKNISNWDKKKLRGLNLLFSFLHFIALVIVPVIIVSINYKLFTKESGIKLTAIGIIIVVILGLYAYNKLKQAINELPQIKLSQQRFKFGIETILSLMPVIILIIALKFAQSDFNVAIKVIKGCSVSIIIASLIEGLFLKFTRAELSLRNKALELNEIEKRKGLV